MEQTCAKTLSLGGLGFKIWLLIFLSNNFMMKVKSDHRSKVSNLGMTSSFLLLKLETLLR